MRFARATAIIGGDGKEKLNVPAFEGIHQLPRSVQAFAHQCRLLAHGDEGILEEPGLVLGRRGGRHHRVGLFGFSPQC
jgi:hypothetical protein